MRLNNLKEASGDLNRRQFLAKSGKGIAALFAGSGLNLGTIQAIASSVSSGTPLLFSMNIGGGFPGDDAFEHYQELVTVFNRFKKLTGGAKASMVPDGDWLTLIAEVTPEQAALITSQMSASD